MAPETRTPYSSKPTTVLRHLIHPHHPLHLLFIPSEFLCSACDALGSGARYRCEFCDFNLHDICATCPSTAVAAPLHPNHPLFLLNDPLTGLTRRFCHICGDPAGGLLYTCRACDFHVHPLCTQLPMHLHLPLHRHHPLQLRPAAPATCALCFKGCTSWRYRCDDCRLDLHIECALGAGPDVVVQVQPPPPPAAAVFGGGGGGYGAYEMASPAATTVKLGGQDSGVTRKKIYLFVARVAAEIVAQTTGIPLNFF